MSTILSAGKYRGMRRLADPAGRFKMTAVDQRPPIENPIREWLMPSLNRCGATWASLFAYCSGKCDGRSGAPAC